jgi:hypothetical protein
LASNLLELRLKDDGCISLEHLGLKEILAQRKKARAMRAKWDAMAQLERYRAVIGSDVAQQNEAPDNLVKLKFHFGK